MTTRSWIRPFVAVVGLIYLVLGVAGFFTPETAVVGHDTSRTVWIFSSTVILNLVHTALGVLGLLAALRAALAHAYCWALFVAMAGVTAFGILATAFGTARDAPVALNWADNWLHGLTALAALAAGIVVTRTAHRVR
jgi:hypothetical protein